MRLVLCLLFLLSVATKAYFLGKKRGREEILLQLEAISRSYGDMPESQFIELDIPL